MIPATRELQRKTLYDEVWSEPMVRLAKRYGVSDVALAKVCRKMAIPVPPRGYWRRKQTGWRVVQTALPKLRPSIPSAVQVTARQPPATAAERSPDVEAQAVFERQPKNRIRVPRRLYDPHILVRHTAEVLRQARPGLYGALATRRERCLDLRLGPRSVDRALRIMDALIKGLEVRGSRVSISTGERPETHVEVFGQPLQLMLEERISRVVHVPTKKNGSYPSRWDYLPTGQLKLRIHEWVGGSSRKTWSDGKQRRLERMLNDVIRGLVFIADAKRARRLLEEREELARREEQRRRELAEQKRREEVERRRTLEREAE